METTTVNTPLGHSTVSEKPVRLQNRTPDESRTMDKFHACLNVSNLERSVAFYRALLGYAPVKQYGDYAKFELESPPMVLSLKPKRAHVGGPLNHLGLRVTDPQRLEAALRRLKSVNARLGRQDHVQCCYAEQTKVWVTDPDGTLWEVYVLHDDVPDWGEIHNKPKLWKAPIQAFGLRGLIARWFNNAFRAAHTSDQSAIAGDHVEPNGTSCSIPKDK
ncbi:MAG: ArsI/CadI family heavy metal resistance metalloenzyme [Pirellulaceae bacterium]